MAGVGAGRSLVQSKQIRFQLQPSLSGQPGNITQKVCLYVIQQWRTFSTCQLLETLHTASLVPSDSLFWWESSHSRSKAHPGQPSSNNHKCSQPLLRHLWGCSLSYTIFGKLCWGLPHNFLTGQFPHMSRSDSFLPCPLLLIVRGLWPDFIIAFAS